jgi:hypothetical protein
VPNERYVKITMRDRWDQVPYDDNGDPAFIELGDYPQKSVGADLFPTVRKKIRDVFSDEEIVHLVNRALYVMKYQRETHANRRQSKKETK